MLKSHVSGITTVVLAIMAVSPVMSRGGELPRMPEPLANVTLPDKPPEAHWVWLGDFQGGLYSRALLVDADRGNLLGMIDTGWEGTKLDIPRGGEPIYNLGMYMSRGFRGDRVDAIIKYDRNTLNPLGEIVVPPKGIHGWPDPNVTALSDDDRLLWMQFFTPASSIGIADLAAGKYLGEIETSGCAHVMSAGPRQFFTLCGDGSALAVTIGDDGREVSRRRLSGFFDPDRDPLHGSGTRSKNTWYFVSFLGQVHEIHQDAKGALEAGPTWSASEKEGSLTWVPGALVQVVAAHDAKRRLYVLMHLSDLQPKGGGTDFHAQLATEVWVFDLDSRKRIQRIPLKYPGHSVAVSQDERPLVYVASVVNPAVIAYDEATGQPKLDMPVPGFPMMIQPVK